MRSFGTVKPSFWTGPTGRALRAAGANAQLLALYLMTNPMANMIGLYYLPLVVLRKELALSIPEAMKGLKAVEDAGFAAYDRESDTVWVYEMARYQLGSEVSPLDKRLKAIARMYDDLHDCPFLGPFHDRYAELLRLGIRREGASGHQEGAVEAPVSVPSPDPVPVPVRKERSGEETAAWDRFERFWRVYPKRKAKDDAWKAWQKRNPDDALAETIVRAVETQCRDPDWLKDGGQFIPFPATWLNRGGWQDERTEVPAVSADTLRVVRGALDYTAGGKR